MQSFESVQSGHNTGFGSRENKRTAGQTARQNRSDNDSGGLRRPYDDFSQSFGDAAKQVRRKSSNLVREIFEGTILAPLASGALYMDPKWRDEEYVF